MKAEPKFSSEAALCEAFAEAVPDGWTAYNETAGFDMMLVHCSGFQIGVEAKMRLNAKVINQAADLGVRPGTGPGPDARAVLVPNGGNTDLAALCKLLSITVVELRPTPSWDRKKRGEWTITPALPEPERLHGVDKELDTIMRMFWNNDAWFDLCPVSRAELPEYLPDVPAGHPSPVVLGRWKIQAIKVCVWVERFGAITRAHFKALGIDPGRWMNGVWLKKGDVRGEWIVGPNFPLDQFKAGHPTIVEKVIADFDKWSVENGLNALPDVVGSSAVDQGALL